MNGMFRVGMLTLACWALPPAVLAFSFDDLEKIEKEERAERKRSAKQAEERARRERAEEQERQAAAASAGSSSGSQGSGGGSIPYVMVQFGLVGGPYGGGLAKGLSISGGPGRFAPSFSDAATGSIQRSYNGGLAGRYNWSGRSEDRQVSCSGSFNLSGNKSNMSIKVYYDSCRDAGSSEY